MSQVTHLGSAIPLFHRNSMETERAHLRPEITGKFVLAVDGFGPRCDLAVAELTHGFAQLIDLKSEIKIERRIICSRHIRHGQDGGGIVKIRRARYKHKRPKSERMEKWSNGAAAYWSIG